MLKYIFFIFSIILFSISLSAKSQKKPDLVVFFTHGFMSNNANFCDFQEVLSFNLKNNIDVHNISYNTYGENGVDLENPRHRDNISVPVFAKDILKEIHKYYQKNNLDSSTPYAVIAHSQGGLVFLRLIQDCIYDNRPYCKEHFKSLSYDFPQKMSHFFTLMTPFGGSTISNKYKDGGIIRRFLPKRQLRNLAIGSPVLNHSRNILIAETAEKPLSLYDTEIINIAANAEEGWLTYLLTRWFQQTPENGTLESDLAVGLPAARMDFIYYDFRDLANPRAIHTNYADHYYVLRDNHTHVPAVAKSNSCVQWKDYQQNPVYKIVRKEIESIFTPHIQQDSLKKEREEGIFSPNISSFQLELRIHANEEDLKKLKAGDLHVNVRRDREDENLLDYLTRQDDLYNKYSGFNWDSKDKGYVTFFNIGAFKDKHSFEVDREFKANSKDISQQKLFVYIHSKYHKAQKIVTYIRPSFTTVVDVELK